jgi:hypothetical protein
MKSICFVACIVMLGLVLSCNQNNESTVDIADQKLLAENNKPTEGFAAYSMDSAGSGLLDGSADFQQSGENEDQKKDKEPQKQQPRQQAGQQPVAKPDWDKKIIKTAVLNAEVEDYNKFYTSLREKVRNLGGYIAQEEQTQSEYKIENSIMVKVPVDQFDNAVVQLTANTQKINDKKITSQDVTTEVIDTKSRLEAKKQVRLRYIDLLGQAKNMQEILNVQSEINGIQEDIESAAGRIAYLGHSSTYSTIHFTYYQVLNSDAKDKEKPSFASELGTAFNVGWNWIGNVFIGIVTLWPLALIVFAIIIIYKRTKIKLKSE